MTDQARATQKAVRAATATFSPVVLAGRVAVVTGGSSGIGRGIAEAMAAAGAELVLVGRDTDRLDQAAKGIVDSGGRATAMTADLTKDGSAEDVVAGVQALHGGIDILVHGAGICLREDIGQMTVGTLDSQWQINVRTPYELTLAACPHLRPAATIIFISSVVARVASPELTAYSATKAAVEALSAGLAAALASCDVRVNTIAPGFVATPMNARFRESGGAERALAATPVGRLGTVEEIADVAVFLASPAARFIYGEVVGVDGGYPTPFSATQGAAREPRNDQACTPALLGETP